MNVIRKNNTKAFTLIELVLYLAMISGIMLTISYSLATLLEARIKNQAIAEVNQQGQQVLQIITQISRNSIAIRLPVPQSSSNAMTLTVPNPNDPTIFTLVSNAIMISEGGGTQIPLTNGRVVVSDLSFRNLTRTNTPGTVKIQFTLTHLNPENRSEYAFSKTFYGTATLRFP